MDCHSDWIFLGFPCFPSFRFYLKALHRIFPSPVWHQARLIVLPSTGLGQLNQFKWLIVSVHHNNTFLHTYTCSTGGEQANTGTCDLFPLAGQIIQFNTAKNRRHPFCISDIPLCFESTSVISLSGAKCLLLMLRSVRGIISARNRVLSYSFCSCSCYFISNGQLPMLRQCYFTSPQLIGRP